MLSPDADNRHASEEYLEDRVHVVDKHLLKRLLVLLIPVVILFRVVPHFQDNDFVDVPIFALSQIIVKVLWFFLLVL